MVFLPESWLSLKFVVSYSLTVFSLGFSISRVVGNLLIFRLLSVFLNVFFPRFSDLTVQLASSDGWSFPKRWSRFFCRNFLGFLTFI